MRLDQTLGRASAHQVVVRVQMRGPTGVEVRECPAAEFEPSDRGVSIGSVFVPWARIFRYDTIVEQGFIPEGREQNTRTIQRVLFEDERGSPQTVEVPLDRYEAGPWTLTVVIERTADRQRGRLSIRKVCIPWARVIETERVFTVPDAAPAVEQVDAPPVVGQADPTIREWFERAERDDDETSDAEEEEEAAPAAAPASAVTRAPEAERTG